METTIVYRGYVGIMGNKLESPILYRGCRGYIAVMDKKMETTI